VTIDGKDALVKVVSAESIEITVPAGLANGTYDLVVTSSDGVLTAQAILNVGGAATTGAAQSSMKRSADGILKVRVFEPVGAGKVQIFFNGKEIAWVNATSSADAKLTNGYLVRTLNLAPGKNVVEVFVDGKRVDRKAYTK
jgi:hypothetical protein